MKTLNYLVMLVVILMLFASREASAYQNEPGQVGGTGP